jgi:STE24 endopeptidase
MEDSARVKAYNRTRRLLGVAGFLLDLAVLVILLVTSWSVSLPVAAERVSHHSALALLVFLGLFGLTVKVTGLPLDFIRGYWLEHRYGLSNLTLGGWVKDQFKGFAVGGVLVVIALECVYAAMRRWPEHWWLISGALFAGFFVVLAHLAPVVVFPIFFRFKPLENPSLNERLLALSRRAGTQVQGVFVWELSAKSKKANAALVGLANTRRIVVADTLLEKFSDDEIEAVLAHELGHHMHRHVFQGLTLQTGATFLGFFLMHIILRRFRGAFGFSGLADFANLPLLGLVVTALSLILLPAVNAHSRAMERQADAYALRAIPSRHAFVTSMQKLAELNLAELRPPAWMEFLFHSHPSIQKRIDFAERFPVGG